MKFTVIMCLLSQEMKSSNYVNIEQPHISYIIIHYCVIIMFELMFNEERISYHKEVISIVTKTIQSYFRDCIAFHYVIQIEDESNQRMFLQT
jgi:hypothetical protein